jgi:alanyl-tRNA synthetase
MGHVFPQVRTRQDGVEDVIRREEEAFNKTLDHGIENAEAESEAALYESPAAARLVEPLQQVFGQLEISDASQDSIRAVGEHYAAIYNQWVADSHKAQAKARSACAKVIDDSLLYICDNLGFLGYQGGSDERKHHLDAIRRSLEAANRLKSAGRVFSGDKAFELYDTYGFPLDLTELMAREYGLTVDVTRFNSLMEEQKARARAAQKKQVIELSQVETTTPTHFIGYDKLETPANVLEVIGVKDKTAVILDTSPLYAEMGGQVGDTGEISANGQLWSVTNTQKAGNAWLHFLGSEISNFKSQIDAPSVGSSVTLTVDRPRRFAIQRHHTVTHLLHWALHEVVSKDAVQKGSYVGPDKLTFDFSSAPLTPQQVADVEKLVNERILENAGVSWIEVPYADVKSRKDIMQFFGEKYGDKVRVVQIGGGAGEMNGYSMELCGGTHTRATGEIGLFRIVAESAIAAGIRRIEAVSGLEAYKQANDQLQLIRSVAGKVNSPVNELEKKIESLLAQQKEREKQLKSAQQKQATETARSLSAKAQTVGPARAIIENLGPADGDLLQSIADALKGQFKGVVVLGGSNNGAVSLVATVSPDLTKQFQAGKIIQTIAPIVGGKGGGKPDNARGGGKDVSKLDEALAKARALLQA